MKTPKPGLIILDRDGVLNSLVLHPEQGTIDSPLHPRQVQMIPRAANAVAQLNKAGFGVVIVTNQPAAAKGKTTRRQLTAVHNKVIGHIRRAGGRILSSYICFHRAEDRCACRKPRTALLEKAFQEHPRYAPRASWLIGDGLSDMQAGHAMRLKTIFLAAHKCDTCQAVLRRRLRPTLWADDLWKAVKLLV